MTLIEEAKTFFLHSISVRIKISIHKFSYGYVRDLNPKINKKLNTFVRTAICWECITSAKFQICYRYQVFSLFIKTDIIVERDTF